MADRPEGGRGFGRHPLTPNVGENRRLGNCDLKGPSEQGCEETF
jgi:hypothetical protein